MNNSGKGLSIGRTQPFKKQSHDYVKRTKMLLPPNTKNKKRFDPNMLPTPRDYYAGVLKKFHPRKQQATALCPFHKDSNPSFSVDLKRGRFFCFSCGAAGGDIIDFYKRLHGIDFVQAITDLGAWEYE